MRDAKAFEPQAARLAELLSRSSRVLITAPGVADGDSVGAQLAVQALIRHCYPDVLVGIVNDEPLQSRYHSVLGVETIHTPESWAHIGEKLQFDIGIVVDGGIDRAGRLREVYDACPDRVFLDHHAVSCAYPYTLPIVAPDASATTELIFHLSQMSVFQMPVSRAFAEWIYLGLIFDTGMFRNASTSAEVLELAAVLLRTGFDAHGIGQRVLLERPVAGFHLLAETLSKACWRDQGRTLWSSIAQKDLERYRAEPDDREGIIDSMVTTKGVEVAALFFELPAGRTKVSLRSRGTVNVAEFARSLGECGGGHRRAAGAELALPLDSAISYVLGRLGTTFGEPPARRAGEG